MRGIKPDNWLRCQSEKPTHVIHRAYGVVEYASPPFSKEQTAMMAKQYQESTNVTYNSEQDLINMIYNSNRDIIRPITEEELSNWKPMIEPFIGKLVEEENGKKVISYGLSSYGYDLRIGNKFKIFTNINSTVVNPKNFDKRSFVDFEGDVCIIPPNSFVLAASLEYIRVPRNITGIVLGKSTYARAGIACIATPLEAGWEGHVTLEFANTTPLPVMLYANEGAAQVLFFEGEECSVSYADRNGKYQYQEAIPVPPKV